MTAGWTVALSAALCLAFVAAGAARTASPAMPAGIAAGSLVPFVRSLPENVAPTVNAGPDQAIVLPAGVLLSGGVKDDGLPVGGKPSLIWTEQSGEGRVTFAAPAAPSTSASFSLPGTYVLRLTANDGQLSAFDEVTVIVRVPVKNRAPTVSAGPNLTITLPNPATLAGQVADDGLPVGSVVSSVWTSRDAPAPVVFSPATAPVTTATFSRPGVYSLRLTATDGAAITKATVTVTVLAEPNDAPVVSAGADQAIVAPAGAMLVGTATDDGVPAGRALSTLWTEQSGEGRVAFGSPTALTTAASFSLPGTYVLRLTANDGARTAFDEVTVVVRAPVKNQAPIVSAGPNQTITLPAGVTLRGSVTDDGLPARADHDGSKGPGDGAADGRDGGEGTREDDDDHATDGTLTSAWRQVKGPGTARFVDKANPVTTATFDRAGVYVLRLTASDGKLSASSDLTITVHPAAANQPPVVSAGPDQTIALPNGATLTGSVTDDGLPVPTRRDTSRPGDRDDRGRAGPDYRGDSPRPGGRDDRGRVGPDGKSDPPTGGALTIAWSQVSGPGLARFADPAKPVTTVAFDRAGIYVLRLTASDGALSASSEVTITVTPATTNQPPAVNGGQDQTITLPSVGSLSGTATDDGFPAGSSLTVQWTVESGGAVTFGDASAASTTATFAQPGTYVLRLTGSDGTLTAFDTVTVTVLAAPPPPNAAPVVAAGGDQTITLPSVGSLSGTATDDGFPAGSSLTVQWTVESGGAVTFGDASAASTTATFAQPGTYVLRLTGSDGTLTAFDTVTVVVNAAPIPNVAPVVNAGPDQTTTLGVGPLPLPGTASDDGQPPASLLTVQWTRDFGPAAVTFTSAASASTSVSFTQTGTYVLRLTGTDGARTSVDTVTVIVNPAPIQNLPPVVIAGLDQAVTLPSQAELSGAATDDGIPTGSTLLAQWSLDNGPAPVTFSNAASPSTLATFTVAGTYVLRLAASDGNLSAFDTVTVAVSPVPPPTNLSPTVNAGPDQTIAFPVNRVSLAGTASDDGLPVGSSVVLVWTRESGAGTVTFGNAATAATTASFDQPGTHVLRLTATDGALAAVDTVTIVVNPPANQAPVVNADADQVITLPINEVALAGSAIDDGLPTGAPVTFRWSVISGPTVPAFGDVTARDSSATFPVAGIYVLRLTATDGDRAGTDEVSITVNPGAAPPPPANRNPVAHAGGPYTGDATSPLGLTAGGSTDPDGDTLTYQWSFGDGQSGSGRTPTHTWAEAGVFNISVTVTDGRGGSATATTQATVGPPADRAPPSVQLRAPAQVLPGETFTATAEVADNVAVTGVTFEVNAANPSDTTAAPYQRLVTAPPLAAPGTTIALRATARDAGGNTGVATANVLVTAAPDTEPPTLTLQAPPTTAPGSQVLVTAQAADNVGVVSVSFALAGQSLGSDPQAPYEALYTVPAGTPVGTTLTFTARAADAAGNATDRAASVQVIAAPDAVPPTITLTAPAETAPGATITVTATAADNVGIAGVQFLADGVPLGTDATAPYSIDLPVASTRSNGSVIRTRAVATDFSGLTASSTADTVVRSQSLGAGMVFGEVYDDATGLPIEDVQVRIDGAGPGGTPYVETAVTDARGRYVAQGREGAARVTLTKGGWTSVVRTVVVPGNRAVEALDARLTPVGDPIEIAAVLGRTFETVDARLEVSGGALSADAALQLTRVSSQGLAGLLPPGWSPVAALDLSPSGLDLSLPAVVSARQTVTLPAATPVAVLAWDASDAAWRVIAVTTAGAPTAMLEANLVQTTAVVWAVADLTPASPPAPVAGDLLTGVDAPGSLGTNASVLVTPQPNILVYQPGVRSLVGGLLTSDQPVSSGLVLRANLRERYEFFSGAATVPDPFQHDIVFYQFTGTATSLSAPFTVSPSITFESAFLRQGVITVELVERGATTDASIIGVDGGTASSETGESVTVPTGALAGDVPVVVARVSEAELGLSLSAPLQFVAAAHVSFSGATLTAPAALAVPRPSGLFNDDGLLLLRVTEIDGGSRLVLVGLGRIAGERIVSDTAVPGVATPLEGIRAGGRYVFARITAPFGFAAGLVRGTNNLPFAGALISSSTVPTFAMSHADGQYVTVALSGPTALQALDVVRRDTGSATGVLTAGGILRVDLRIVFDPPRVTSVTPAAAAVDVSLGAPVVVSFSEPIDPASIGALRVETGGALVPGAVTLSDNNRLATFRAAEILASATSYTVRVTTGLTDLSGRTLATEFASTFTSLNTAPPPPPPAGAITATLPGTDGLTTVSGTQGSAGLHDTVDVLNVTQGTSTRALVNANGSFSTTVAAALGDRLQIVITNQGGGQTVVSTPPFARTNADGSRSVVTGSAGGRLEGPSGVVVDVPEGAFPDGTLVTMRYVDEPDFPIPLTAQQRELFAFSGGVQLDFGGATPQHYLNVSIPASPGDRQTDRWVVGAVQQVNGRLLLNSIDTARVIGGRITTASPPCPGVQAAATYGYIKSTTQPIGVVYGRASGGNGTQTYGMEIIDPYSINATVMPWSSYTVGPTPQPTCFPILTGRTTVTPNTQRLAIQADQFAPTSREITVRNVNSGATLRFPRNVIEYRFVVAGTTNDTYRTSVITPEGEVVVPHEVSPAAVDFTVIRLDMDTVFANVSEVVIRNITGSPPSETRLAQAQAEVEVPVSGGATDTYAVTIIDNEGGEVTPEWTLRSPRGEGNLWLNVLPVTIDPGTDVVLINATQGTSTTVPEDYVQHGGVIYPFTAAVTDRFGLRVDYPDGRFDVTGIPRVRIVVRNGETGRVVRTIEAPVPPLDEPFFNLGAIDGDTEAPRIVSSPGLLMNFDPSAPLSFTFSEGIDRLSALDGVRLTTEDGIVVAGEVRLSIGNTVVTFVPASPLKLGTTYHLRLDGLKDGANNAVRPFAITLTTFEPRRAAAALASGTINGTIRDIAFLTIPQAGGQPRKFGYEIIDDGNVAYLVTLDMTDPENPVQLSSRLGGNSSVTVVQDIQNLQLRAASECGGATSFSGNLAITTNFTNVGSAVQFWDLTDPVEPCLMGSKLLTVNAQFASGNRGAIVANGRARRPVAVKNQAGVMVYIAVEEVGLLTVDVGGNSPRVLPANGVREPFAAGNYTDLIDTGSVLVAAERREQRIDFFDTNLTLLNQLDLGDGSDEVLSLAYAPGWAIDDDQNGIIDPQEVHNLLLVGASTGLGVIDITNLDAPVVLGAVPLQGSVFRIVVDVARRRVYTGGARVLYGNDWSVSMIDLGSLNAYAFRDNDQDGIDDRVIWQTPDGYSYQRHGYRALTLDAERGALYVGLESAPGATGGVDVWTIINICCDLGVDFRDASDTSPKGDREVVLVREKRALEIGLSAGLLAAQACGVPIRRGLPITGDSITIIEQGSGACLWKGNPVSDCSPAYQPGLSDHDYEVFIPARYLPGDQTSGGKCVLKALSDQFTDANKKPKPIEIGGGVTMSFKDVTFFPVARERFEDARLDVEPPRDSVGNDATGDLGLGRQQLLLKWVLEGEYIEVPGWHVTGRPLEDIMTELRDGTRILPLEGYEWAKLQRFNLVKSNSFLRIRGASEPTSAFHELFVNQLHDAGKTGIRAALARMVADERGNEMVLDVTRGSYASNACLLIRPDQTPAQWRDAPCRSFEEYVASAAGRTLQRNLTLFTAEQVSQTIHRFFQVKADEEPRITGELAADQFIAMASRFIESVVTETEPIYRATIGSDQNSARRTENMALADTKTVQALATGKLQVIPRVYQRGFNNANDIALNMYRGRVGGPPTPLKALRLSLAANETRGLRTGQDILLPAEADGLSEEDRNLNDLSSGSDSTRQPLFMLGDGSDENPYINFSDTPGQPRYVAFTFDLPEKKMQEAYRRNNYAGFYYHVLDRVNGVFDQAPAVPLPIPDPDGTLLDPEEQCVANLDVQVTQQVQRIGSDGSAIGAATTDFVLARGGETLLFRVTVRNNTAQEIADVKVCNTIAASGQECISIGTLGPSEETIEDFVHVIPASAEGEYRDAIPSVESPLLGTIAGPSLRVVVSCDDVAVVPAPGNPIPVPSASATDAEDAKVMRGGQGLRSYRIVTRDGSELHGHTVEIEVTTPGSGTFVTSYFSDTDGSLTLGADSGPFVVVNVEEDLPIDTKITARIKSIDGRPSYCMANTELFTMVVADRTWSKQWQAGASIGGTVSLVKGLTFGGSTGFGFKIDEVHGKNRDKLTFARTNGGTVGLVVELGSTQVKGYLFGAGGRLGAEAKASASVVQSRSDEHEFKYSAGQTALTQEQSAVLGGLIMSMAATQDPLVARILDQVNPLINTEPYRSLESFSFGAEVGASAEAKGELGFFARAAHHGLAQKTPVKFGVEGGGTAGGAFAAAVSISDAFLKKELTPAVEVKFTGSLDAGLGLGSGEIERDPIQGQKKLELTRFLRGTFKANYAGGAKLGITFDSSTGATKKLTLTFTEQKSWGWGLDTQTDGNQVWTKKGGTTGEIPKVSYEFTITDPATVKKVAAKLEGYGVLLGGYVVGTQLPLTPPQLGPTLAIEALKGIVDVMTTSNGTFTRSVEIGEAVSLPSGLGARLVGVGADIALTISADRALSYTEATGVIRNGNIYELTRNARSLFPYPGDAADEFVELGRLAMDGVIALAGNAIDFVTGGNIGPGNGQVRSNRTAQLDLNGAGETPFAPSIASWIWEPGSNPGGYRIQRPIDSRGPVDVGHYGVGGFHQFLPKSKTLVNPATLTFFYLDSELGTMDENELSIYRWNIDREDWDFVGGTRNPGANTVTATVNELALYTMAPPLPAGRIALTTEWTAGGTDESPTTTETYTTDTLRLNTGAVVPDGTLYTVTSATAAEVFVPYGTVLTPDADLETPGTQVASTGGTLQFTVVYPSASDSIRPMVFSKAGTALAATLTALRPE